jgi:hypothetical protein
MLSVHSLILLAEWASQPLNEAGESAAEHSSHSHGEIQEVGVHTGTFGMEPSLYAYILGTASGVSLIIGAILGCRWAPVSDLSCSAMMSFGAGALLFAVTIELYAHALHQLRSGHILFYTEMLVIILAAVTGAAFYLYINQMLEDYLMSEEGPGTVPKSPKGKGPKSPKIKITNVEDGLAHEATGTESARTECSTSRSTTGRCTGSALANYPVKEPRKQSVIVSLQQTHALPPPTTAPSRPAKSALLPPAIKTALPSETTPLLGESHEEKQKRLRARAKALWRKVRTKVMFMAKVKIQAKNHPRGRERGVQAFVAACKDWAKRMEQPRAEGEEDDSEERQAILKHAKLVALQLFLGLLVDGVPEAVLMGFLAAKGHLTPVLIVALFFANFPEAFSSASLLTVARLSPFAIVGMWTFLCVVVGIIAGISCWALLAAFPGYATGELLPTPVLMCIASIEGLTGGAMIACIAHVMLPEAFERMGKSPPLYLSSGFMCTCGFLSAVLLKSLTD